MWCIDDATMNCALIWRIAISTEQLSFCTISKVLLHYLISPQSRDAMIALVERNRRITYSAATRRRPNAFQLVHQMRLLSKIDANKDVQLVGAPVASQSLTGLRNHPTIPAEWTFLSGLVQRCRACNCLSNRQGGERGSSGTAAGSWAFHCWTFGYSRSVSW